MSFTALRYAERASHRGRLAQWKDGAGPGGAELGRPPPPVLMINGATVRGQLRGTATLQIRNYFRPLVANFIINYTLKFHNAVLGAVRLDNRSLWSLGELLRGSTAHKGFCSALGKF